MDESRVCDGIRPVVRWNQQDPLKGRFRMTRTTRMTVMAMVCVLAGVGVAVAQDRGQHRGPHHEGGQCEHHDERGRAHGPRHMLKKMDANNDGRITRDEFNTATQERFKRMDQNNDGVIAGDELQHGR